MYIYICVCVYKSEKEEGTRGAEFSEARSQPRKSLKYTQEREEKNTHSLSVIPATTTSTTTRERASQNAGLLLLKIKRICSVRWRSFLLLLLSLRAFANTRVYVGVCVCSHFFFLFFFFFSSFFFFFLLLSRLKKPQKKKNKSINNNNNNTFTL